MKPHEVARLASHYAAEAGIAENGPIRDLQTAVTRFDGVVGEHGRPVYLRGGAISNAPLYFDLAERLNLGEHEGLFDVHLMPVHDESDQGGRQTFSRFLVIDARNPSGTSKEGTLTPMESIRAYFLLLTPWLDIDLQAHGYAPTVFPYYVVDERTTTSRAEGLPAVSWVPQVFHARYDGNAPLDVRVRPERVYDPEVYTAMAAELQLAVQNLGG